MVKEKIQKINWPILIYAVSFIFTVGSFVALTKAKCEQVEENKRDIKANRASITELEISISSQSRDIQYIKEGVDNINRSLRKE